MRLTIISLPLCANKKAFLLVFSTNTKSRFALARTVCTYWSELMRCIVVRTRRRAVLIDNGSSRESRRCGATAVFLCAGVWVQPRADLRQVSGSPQGSDSQTAELPWKFRIRKPASVRVFCSDNSSLFYFQRRPHWSRGSVLATGPKVRGFKLGRGRWIFKGDKNP
jgi:hypothetical protein